MSLIFVKNHSPSTSASLNTGGCWRGGDGGSIVLLLNYHNIQRTLTRDCSVVSVDNVYVQTVPVMEDMVDIQQVYYTGTNNNTQVPVISGHSQSR